MFYLIVLATAAPAAAQSSGRFAVGGSVGTRIAPSSTVGGHPIDWGLIWRFGHSEEGWGWDGGLNWFASEVDRSLAGAPTFELGKLHVRPLMVGYGYTHRIGPTAIKAGALGGYAFVSFTTGPTAADEYRNRLGAQSLSIDTGNTFVVKPQISVWRDINQKLGVNVSAGYLVARPNLTIRTSQGEQSERVRSDQFTAHVGLVYSVF
jgi:hypothetical protein